ncbi:MAG: hypothetical protein WAL86_06425 [Candidatus Acidiferrales bacterium]
MTSSLNRPSAVAVTIAALAIFCAMPASAQKKDSEQAKGINRLNAPIPAPLLNAKRVFISYELGDVSAFPSTYSGGPERAYSEFITAMKAWGRYQLVLDPKDADVIFGIRFVEPGQIPPQVRLGISDARTGVPLWGFVEEINPAARKKNRDADFSAAVLQVASDVRALIEPGAPPVAKTQ